MRRLPLLAPLCLAAGIASHAAIAQDGAERAPQTTLLKALTVDLNGDRGSNIYRAIWHDVFDQELALRQRLSERTKRPPVLTTDVFAAAFAVPDGEIIVSATDTGNGCQSYTNIGLPSSLMTCPMKVALVHDHEPKIIYSSDSFAFSIGVDSEGKFENENPENRTAVTFDPVKKMLSTRLFEAGQPANTRVEGFNPNADNSQIYLKY